MPIEALAHNPLNLREDLTDLDELAQSLIVRGQLQPLAVATRMAFMEAHPGQTDGLGRAPYVVIDGNRRLAAAQLAGLKTMHIHVNDALAASAADILESALIANVHRVDVAPLDQARAIQELVDVHGSQAQVAKRLGKTPAWVSQRLALLNLTPPPSRRRWRRASSRSNRPAGSAVSRRRNRSRRRPRALTPLTPPRQRTRPAPTVNGVNAVNAAPPRLPPPPPPPGSRSPRTPRKRSPTP
ncbi:hypothetical protein GCM10020254_01350 [Streptomyces goshikiensis]